MSDTGNQSPIGIQPSGYGAGQHEASAPYDSGAQVFAAPPGPPDSADPPDPPDSRSQTRSVVAAVLAWVALAVAVAALIVAFWRSDGDIGPGGGSGGIDSAERDTSDEMFGANSDDALAGSGTEQATPTTIATVQTVPVDSGGDDGQDAAGDDSGEGGQTGDASDAVTSDSRYSQWSVIGIAHDSSLNIRNAPGGDVLARLEPATTGILPTGTSRDVEDVTWYEVNAGGVIGWVSGQYVGPLGLSVDVTDDVLGQLGDDAGAADLAELGRKVAALRAATEPESRVRIAVAPVEAEGGGGTITMDVVGQPDDSIRGYRVMITAGAGEGGQGVVVRGVEATVICYNERGVAPQGFCN